jgi:hypothetical protein
MRVTLCLALLLQFVSVVLLRVMLGKTWLRRPGTLMVLTSVVYDGVSQVALAFPSVAQWDTFRNGTGQSFTGEATLVLSAAMLAFTAAYALTSRHRAGPASARDAVPAARVADWRLLALACLPLAVLTYEGRGYANGSLTTGAGAPLGTSIAGQFFTLLIVLAAFAFLMRHGRRWFIGVLAAQSLLLAAAGERSAVIIDAVTLVMLLCLCGQRPRTSHLHAALALTVLAVLAITGVRAQQGRAVFYADSGLGARAEALGGALGGGAAAGTPGLIAQAAARMDGTAFTAGILQAEHDGQPRLGAGGVAGSLLLAVPTAAWPGKLSSAGLNPALTQTGDFGLQKVNFLPGVPGLYAGFLSPAWLAVFMAGLGATWGRGERWLLRERAPARLVLLAGASAAAMSFEQGLPGMAVTLRAAAVLAVSTWAAGRVYPARRRITAPGPPLPPVPLAAAPAPPPSAP